MKRIALAVPLGWEYIYSVTEGIFQFQAERGGYSLRDFRFDDPSFVPPPEPPTWEGWRPSGIICAVGNRPDFARWLLSARLPIVNVTVDVDPHVMPSVHATGAGPLGIKHLSSLGFRRIAHVGLSGTIGSERRYENLELETRRLGLELLRHDLTNDPVGLSSDRAHLASTEPGLLRFLRDAPKPLGIIAINDDFARCVCQACAALNIRVPIEVAVIGVDDTTAARCSEPPITSIRPPGRKVGYESMRLLESLFEGAKPPKATIQIPCSEIVIRESTQIVKDDSVARAKQIIEAEATRGLTVSDLANVLAVSRSNLEMQYKEYFGVSPAQEIKRVKFEKAQELLKNTELSITQIAAMLGYSRHSVFTEFFRNYAKMTPSEFRDAKPESHKATTEKPEVKKPVLKKPTNKKPAIKKKKK